MDVLYSYSACTSSILLRNILLDTPPQTVNSMRVLHSCTVHSFVHSYEITALHSFIHAVAVSSLTRPRKLYNRRVNFIPELHTDVIFAPFTTMTTSSRPTYSSLLLVLATCEAKCLSQFSPLNFFFANLFRDVCIASTYATLSGHIWPATPLLLYQHADLPVVNTCIFFKPVVVRPEQKSDLRPSDA